MDIFKLLDRPIAFHRVFAELAGSIAGGVLLSQAVYWSRRSSTGDGWFYKSREEWEEETFLTRWEQESARATLREIGVLEESLRSMPRRLFFRINFDRLGVLLLVEKPPTSRRKNLQQAGGKTSSINRNRDYYRDYTEIFIVVGFADRPKKQKKMCGQFL